MLVDKTYSFFPQNRNVFVLVNQSGRCCVSCKFVEEQIKIPGQL